MGERGGEERMKERKGRRDWEKKKIERGCRIGDRM